MVIKEVQVIVANNNSKEELENVYGKLMKQIQDDPKEGYFLYLKSKYYKKTILSYVCEKITSTTFVMGDAGEYATHICSKGRWFLS